MSLRNLQAVLALSAIGSYTRQGVKGSPVLGVDERVTWDLPEGKRAVIYSVLLSGITASDTPTLSLLTGEVTLDGTTADGAGKDYQGNPLPELDEVLAIVMERVDADFTEVTAQAVLGDAKWVLGWKNVAMQVTPDVEGGNLAGELESLVFTQLGIGLTAVQVRVTVVGIADEV